MPDQGKNPFEQSGIELQSGRYEDDNEPAALNLGPQNDLDLRSYAKLAYLRLKSLKPLFFLAILVLGWSLSYTDDYAGQDLHNGNTPGSFYCTEDVPAEDLAKWAIAGCNATHYCYRQIATINPPPGATGWGPNPRLCIHQEASVNLLSDLPEDKKV
eukprot:TRINITY_DN18929_c0_g2_i3.p1 TRINITY_DN18929_c0_g2~~TRINITY_DN18929_c0_g2_i3.p1  ORF type:complete len:157 (+),score=31.31 TRINITY_DN18929_c0_g2_i3:239-709(+)